MVSSVFYGHTQSSLNPCPRYIARQHLYARTHLAWGIGAWPSAQSCCYPARESIGQPREAHCRGLGWLKIIVIEREKDWTRERKWVRVAERRQKAWTRYYRTQRVHSRNLLSATLQIHGEAKIKVPEILPLKPSAILLQTKRSPLIREAINRILNPGTYKKGRSRQSCYW